MPKNLPRAVEASGRTFAQRQYGLGVSFQCPATWPEPRATSSRPLPGTDRPEPEAGPPASVAGHGGKGNLAGRPYTSSAGGVHQRRLLVAGEFRLRLSGRFAHRVELFDGPCWTLFITGPRYREWGFHCPEQGWVHWKRFTAANDPGAIGPGCDA